MLKSGEELEASGESPASDTSSVPDGTHMDICGAVVTTDIMKVRPIFDKLISDLNQLQELSQATSLLTNEIKKLIIQKSIDELSQKTADDVNADP